MTTPSITSSFIPGRLVLYPEQWPPQKGQVVEGPADRTEASPHRAWLYCTYFGDMCFIGEIKDEGSFEELIELHVARNHEGHRHTIHILVEGTPEALEWESFVRNCESFDRNPGRGWFKKLKSYSDTLYPGTTL